MAIIAVGDAVGGAGGIGIDFRRQQVIARQIRIGERYAVHVGRHLITGRRGLGNQGYQLASWAVPHFRNDVLPIAGVLQVVIS